MGCGPALQKTKWRLCYGHQRGLDSHTGTDNDLDEEGVAGSITKSMNEHLDDDDNTNFKAGMGFTSHSGMKDGPRQDKLLHTTTTLQ